MTAARACGVGTGEGNGVRHHPAWGIINNGPCHGPSEGRRGQVWASPPPLGTGFRPGPTVQRGLALAGPGPSLRRNAAAPGRAAFQVAATADPAAPRIRVARELPAGRLMVTGGSTGTEPSRSVDSDSTARAEPPARRLRVGGQWPLSPCGPRLRPWGERGPYGGNTRTAAQLKE